MIRNDVLHLYYLLAKAFSRSGIHHAPVGPLFAVIGIISPFKEPELAIMLASVAFVKATRLDAFNC